MTTTLSKKGQIVIPHELRERHNLHPGDTVQIEESGDAIVLRKPKQRKTLAAFLRECPRRK